MVYCFVSSVSFVLIPFLGFLYKLFLRRLSDRMLMFFQSETNMARTYGSKAQVALFAA